MSIERAYYCEGHHDHGKRARDTLRELGGLAALRAESHMQTFNLAGHPIEKPSQERSR